MKIMGLDLGNKSCGVSISDISELLATSYPTIYFKYKDFDFLLGELKKMIESNNVGRVVLGLPKNMDGSVGEQGQICLGFGERLKTELGMDVVMFDERLTSKLAVSSMILGNENKKNRQTEIDRVASKIILQDYLDQKRR